MKKNRILELLIMLVVILAFTPFIQGGCRSHGGGGGGGGIGGEEVQPEELVLAMLSDADAENALSTIDLAALDEAIDHIEETLDEVLNTVSASSTASGTPWGGCSNDDGDISYTVDWEGTWDGNGLPESCDEVNDLHFVLTAENCVWEGGWGEGTYSTSYKETLNGTKEFTASGSSCAPTEIRMLLNFSSSLEETGPEYSYKSTANYDNLSIVFSNITLESTEKGDMNLWFEDVEAAFIHVNGSTAGSYSYGYGGEELQPYYTWDTSFDKFNIGYVEINVDGVGSRTEVTGDGNIKIGCLNPDDWVLVETVEPVVFPYDGFYGCPVDGAVNIFGAEGTEIGLSFGTEGEDDDYSLDISVNGGEPIHYDTCWNAMEAGTCSGDYMME